MKRGILWAGRAAASGEEYLKRLGGYLLWYFPANQTMEILTDYREYFAQEEPAQGLSRWGTPEQALFSLLAENAGAKGYFYKRIVFWGALLLFSFLCLWRGGRGLLFAGLLLPPSLFGFIRGWGRLQLQRRFFPQERLGKRDLLACLPAAAAVFLLEVQMQLICRYADRLPVFIGNIPIGRLLSGECLLLGLLFFCLALWQLWRALTHSVNCLSGVFHALGALLFILGVREVLCSLTSSQGLSALMLLPLLHYGIGAGFALALTGLIRRGKRA
ncbi:MAG: hypothetical protein HFG27_05925 [Provencibacterium sp.]|jgi:hypothetical protein|nr:hypothetical protein [Provencibacterium sp.]